MRGLSFNQNRVISLIMNETTLVVPTPLGGGGGGRTIKSNVCFVQTILAGRYTHRREMRMVSLEILSSVEHGIKKFFIFVFYRELSRLKLLRK